MSTHQNFFEKYNTFIAIIIAAILIGGAIILSGVVKSSGSTPKTQNQEPQKITTVDTSVIKKFITSDRIVLGNKESKNIVIEVSDPSCPFCHFASGYNPELVKQSGRTNYLTVADGGTYNSPGIAFEELAKKGEIAYVYSYGDGHGNGRLAAEALYCAHERDGFWPAHKLLMSNKGYTLVNDTVGNDRTKSAEIAKFLNNVIDESYMTECLSTAKYESRVARDLSENQLIGFSGTPHFVINGNIVQGAADFSSMKGFIK